MGINKHSVLNHTYLQTRSLDKLALSDEFLKKTPQKNKHGFYEVRLKDFHKYQGNVYHKQIKKICDFYILRTDSFGITDFGAVFDDGTLIESYDQKIENFQFSIY